MDYSKLASEVRNLYCAFLSELFNEEQAVELTKTCIREFQVFKDLVESETAQESIVGHVYFVDGTSEPFYTYKQTRRDTYEFLTKNYLYRRVLRWGSNVLRTHEYPVWHYYKYDDSTGRWDITDTVVRIELTEESSV